MASYDKKISQFSEGSVDLNSYFLQANSGASTKVSSTELADFVGESRLYTNLSTTAQTLVGAINELVSAINDLPAPLEPTILSDTLTAGNTTLTISDAAIETTSRIQVFTNPPTAYAVSLSAGQADFTFTAQADDVDVELWIW